MYCTSLDWTTRPLPSRTLSKVFLMSSPSMPRLQSSTRIVRKPNSNECIAVEAAKRKQDKKRIRAKLIRGNSSYFCMHERRRSQPLTANLPYQRRHLRPSPKGRHLWPLFLATLFSTWSRDSWRCQRNRSSDQCPIHFLCKSKGSPERPRIMVCTKKGVRAMDKDTTKLVRYE